MTRFRPAQLTALALGALLLAAAVADVPLARLAHQSVEASGGSFPVWISAGFGAVGFVVAWRRARNPLGWALLGLAVLGALSEDASLGLVILLFPDGRPPSPRWRGVMLGLRHRRPAVDHQRLRPDDRRHRRPPPAGGFRREPCCAG